MTISKKLSLQIGLLLILIIIIGIVFFVQTSNTNDIITEIIEIDEPVSAAAYEMEINVIGSGFGLLGYLHDHDPVHLERIKKDHSDFIQFYEKYSRLIELEEGKRLGKQISDYYHDFTAIGDELLNIEIEQARKIETLIQNHIEMDDILNEYIQDQPAFSTQYISNQTLVKLQSIMEMKININEIAGGIGNYLRTHLVKYEALIKKDQNDFTQFMTVFHGLPLSEEDKKTADTLNALFNYSITLTNDIIRMQKQKEEGLITYVKIRREMDQILDEDIQKMTSNELNRIKKAVITKVHITFILIIILITIALCIGITSGILISRSIVKPIKNLVLATQRITADNLKERVNITSYGELHELENNFNKMIETLDKTTISRDFLNNIIASMTDMLIVISNKGIIESVNTITCELLNYEYDKLLNKSIDDIVLQENGEDGGFHKKLLTSRISNHELEFVTKTGKKIPMLLSSAPLYSSSNTLKGAVCVAKDMTELKVANNEIKKSLKEKTMLLKEVHHRVKNNFQLLSSMFSLQNEYIQDDSMKKYIGEFQNRLRAMAIVHEILYQSREFAGVDFNQQVHNLVNSLLRSYVYVLNDISVNINIDSKNILFDIDTAICLGIIINELITNSLKYAFSPGEKGEINIDLLLEKENYILIISDNGRGFPDDFNVESIKTFGLFLINTLVDQIEGTYKIDKTHGTKITIVFPGIN